MTRKKYPKPVHTHETDAMELAALRLFFRYEDGRP